VPRVTIPLEYIADIEPVKDLPRSDEYARIDAGGRVALLTVEVKRMERWAKLTPREASIFELIAKNGLDAAQVSSLLNIEEDQVAQLYQDILKRIRRYPNIGLLTVLVETFGWSTTAAAMLP
jgi:DNA-directed RNA polymerase specialized sigma24 family protein